MHPLIWAEIDIAAVAHNVRELRRVTNSDARLLVVVKANAYGHGAVEIAEAALRNGADALGVARIEEAVQLRDAGVSAPILILGYTDPALAETVIGSGLTPAIWSIETAKKLSDEAVALGRRISVHIKVDTGMGRLGLTPDSSSAGLIGVGTVDRSVPAVLSIAAMPGLDLSGIFTHLAAADSLDKDSANGQLELFLDFVEQLSKAGVEIPLRHAANSAAVIDMPDSHLDMVRAGISVYGCYPSRHVTQDRLRLRPAMSLKTRVVQVKRVTKGFRVSYGSTHQTGSATTIATLPIGYADGLDRRLSSRGRVLVAGCRVPIIGRVCMDLTMVDVGEAPGVAVGDEAVIFGKQEDAAIPVEEVAELLGTVNYEVLSTIAERIPRVYVS